MNEPLPIIEAGEKTVVARSAPRGKTLRLRPQGSIGKKVPRHPIPDAVNEVNTLVAISQALSC